MLSKGISFINFKVKSKILRVRKELRFLLNEKNQVIISLSKNYKNNFNKKILNKYKKFKNFQIIGMGGSILGARAIYDFLKYKIKKNFLFVDNLQATQKVDKKKKIC